jgi:hypothetical protein
LDPATAGLVLVDVDVLVDADGLGARVCPGMDGP